MVKRNEKTLNKNYYYYYYYYYYYSVKLKRNSFFFLNRYWVKTYNRELEF